MRLYDSLNILIKTQEDLDTVLPTITEEDLVYFSICLDCEPMSDKPIHILEIVEE